jgi:enoyl-CoA hydratase
VTYENILFDQDGPVATITINREKLRNALNGATIAEIGVALAEVERADHLRVAIITGAGEKAFAAGADINELRALPSADAARQLAERGHLVGLAIARMRKVVIAAVNGFALGGGCELAMSCDIRLAAASARFGQPEINLGLIPGWGGTQRLTRLAGPGMSKLLNLTGDMIGADEALRIGLVERVYPDSELLEAARTLARQIASKAPLAVAAIKQAIDRGQDMALADACMYEAALFGSIAATADAKEGTGAFLEKRTPTWTGM